MINNNPDVLNFLANLSSDEVFTPPNDANEILDMLPQSLFSDPEAKFLDPACKSGVFLREIAKRLLDGLKQKIPDLTQRINHIFRNQLYGIAITDLTGLISRRTVYCAKDPDGDFSVCKFNDSQGNIRYKTGPHDYNKKGRCKFCGASEKNFSQHEDSESHAYEFIHTEHPERISNMKFDVIISNPPYQLNIGVNKENYAIPIYHKFVEQAKKLKPKYIAMIIPARWYAGGRGLDEFRDEMLHDKHIKILHDFPNSVDCFPSVDIAGGVCYFLWDREYTGLTRIISHAKGEIISDETRPLLEKNVSSFIRHNEAINILRKVQTFNEKTFNSIVSAQTPFGFVSSFSDFSDNPFPDSVKYYTYGSAGYVKQESILRNKQLVARHKVLNFYLCFIS